MRREFTAKVKVAAYERSKGACEACGCKMQPGRIHYDHAIPDALGGEPTLANCAVLCTACHGVKTARQDVPSIARAKRLQAKHVGAKGPSRWPKSKWKRKVSGEVVLR